MTPPSIADVLSRAAGGWIEWNGGECPVEPETIIEAEFGGDRQDRATNRAGAFYWWHSEAAKMLDAHLTAYRVVSK